MKTLVVQPHRRVWDMCPRVCVVCGETHAVGQPTPSGRECEQVQPNRYVPVFSNVTPKRGRPANAIPTARTCKMCGVAKAIDQFNGLHSFRCLACWEEVKAQSVVKQKGHSKAWRAKNPERVRVLNDAACKRWREKRKLKKEMTK
jgi:hypothetical protein